MARVPSPSWLRRLRVSLFALSAGLLPLLASPACGSDDPKKKAPPHYQAGGEGGGDSSGGNRNPSEGGSGASAVGGEGATTTGGASATGSGEGGSQASGGEGASGPDCAPGTADCDDDPSDCEADVSTLDQCGACGVACQQSNGTVICGDSGCEVTSCAADHYDCNETGTDGCEATFDSVENCGFCGRNCGTSTCSAAKLCAGSVIGSAASGYRWVQTKDALYRLSGNTPSYGLATNYTITRTPFDGSAEVVMATGNISPGSIAVDATHVYWSTNGTPPAVVRKAHGASAVTVPTPVFEPVSLPVQMRIQGTDMYWMGQNGIIYMRPLDALFTEPGKPIVNAAAVQGTGAFNLHQDFVTTPTAMYWVVLPSAGNQAFIRTAPLEGGAAADVPGAITNSFFKLWVTGEDLYWIRATGAALDGAYRYRDGVVEAPLVIQAGLHAVMQDGDYLYLLGGSNALYRAPAETGGAALKLGDSAGLAYAMDFAAVNDQNIFVLTSFTHGAGFYPGGSTVKFPK